MRLRDELMPPALDEELVARLAELANRLDGARPGEWDEDLAEFNGLSGMAIPFEDFQGIYGGEEHETWVRRMLYRQSVRAVSDLSREELIEIVTRIVHADAYRDFYLILFLANCKHPSQSDLIYWPNLVPELPQDREPTVEEIADLAMRGPT